nr:transporter substrate-binding domain-containing protein [Kineosphaera limosa]
MAACGSSDSGTQGGSGATDAATGGITTVSSGNLTVCTHLTYKPFEFNQDGQTVGFDIDIVNLAAKEMGLTVQVVDIDFEQITTGAVFTANRCDIAAAGMTITEPRKQAILFSDPYFDATQALLTKTGSGITGLDSLRGKRLGVQTGTTGQEYATKNAEANGYEMVVFDDLPLGVNAVKAGRVDAAINDNGVLYDFAKDNPDTEVVAEFDTGEQYGIGAKKDDANATAIIGKLNEALATARQDGTYDEIYKKWFGTTPGAAQPGATDTQSPASPATSS